MGSPVLRYLKRDLASFRKRPKGGVQVGMPKAAVNPDHLEYLIKDYECIESQLAEAVELLADTRTALPEVAALSAGKRKYLIDVALSALAKTEGDVEIEAAIRAIAKEISE